MAKIKTAEKLSGEQKEVLTQLLSTFRVSALALTTKKDEELTKYSKRLSDMKTRFAKGLKNDEYASAGSVSLVAKSTLDTYGEIKSGKSTFAKSVSAFESLYGAVISGDRGGRTAVVLNTSVADLKKLFS